MLFGQNVGGHIVVRKAPGTVLFDHGWDCLAAYVENLNQQMRDTSATVG